MRDAQFTYDFGIAISQSTVQKLSRLASTTLALAGAYYALKSSADLYVDTLRENTLRFGGMLTTMKAMEQAQDRLIKGQSYFDVADQMAGMNRLMSLGLDVKKNMDWINKAAHATGKSFDQFSGMIASAVTGNLHALVDAGLMTERATRQFARFQGNTTMMRGAIMNFLKNHKGLANAIKNDFLTMEDQMRRLKAMWTGFMQEIMGKPNDPEGLYYQMTQALKIIADGLSKAWQDIKKVGRGIGTVLGWVARNVGKFIVFIGRSIQGMMRKAFGSVDDFQTTVRKLVVWLEFWKLHIVSFFEEYGGVIKGVIKYVLMFMALKTAFNIGGSVISSVMNWGSLLSSAITGASAKWQLFTRLISEGDGIVRATTATLSKMEGPWGKFFDFVDGKVVNFQSFWNGRLAPSASSAFQKMSGRASAFFSSISNGITGTISGMGKLSKSMIVNSKSLMKSAMGNPKALWSSFAGGAKNAFTLSKSFFLNFRGIMMGGFSSLITSIGGGFTTMFAGLKTAGTALMATLNAMNPVAWIIAVIALLAILYAKCKPVREFLNEMIYQLTEWWRVLWNYIVWVFSEILVWGLKVKNGLTKVWDSVTGKIKSMWNAFKDSTIGKWIDKWIVQPITKVYNMIKEIIGWVAEKASGVLSSIADFFGGRAEENAKYLAQNGMAGAASMISGAVADKPFVSRETLHNFGENIADGKYKDAFTGKPAPGANKPTPAPKGNPLSKNTPPPTSDFSDFGGGGSTVNVSSGAIVINAGNVDEQKLAVLIRRELMNLEKQGNTRRGRLNG